VDVLKTYNDVLIRDQKYKVLPKIFQRLGYAVYRYKKDHLYSPEALTLKGMKFVDIEKISPFSEVAEEVINHNRTRLGYDRLYIIYQALWNVRHISTKAANLAEVGVYKGGSTYFIASVADQLFETQPRIHGFDTFEGHSPEDITAKLDEPHKPGKFTDTSFAEVRDYLSGFSNVIIHKGKFQDRCSDVLVESFCFAHVDVDIYAATAACLDFFSDALIIGGILIVDDYGFKTCEGAKRAVDNFMAVRNNFIKFHLETGQCLLIKVV
jgi:O-methyltransferase